MKKLAYIIAFFALLGYAQTRYLHFYDDKYEFFEYCFDIYYDIFWPAEYLADLILYKNKDFDFEETMQVVELMISLFENSIENKLVVTAQRI